MPYALRYAGGGSFVGLTTPVTSPTSSIKIEVSFTYTSNIGVFSSVLYSSTGNSRSQGSLRIQKNGDDGVNVLFTLSGKERVVNTIGNWVGSATPRKVTIEWDSVSQEITVFLDGVLQYTLTGYSTFLHSDIDSLGGRASSANDLPFAGALYGYSYEKDGALLHRWLPSAVGAGLVLPDSVGSNDGVLTNFAAGDSHWVFFEGESPGLPAPAGVQGSIVNGQMSADWTAVPDATGYQVEFRRRCV